MTEVVDPFFGGVEDGGPPSSSGAPADSLVGVYGSPAQDGDPVQLLVLGTPVPWAVAQNPRGGGKGGRFIPARQARQAARFMQEWEKLGLAPVPKPYGVVCAATFYVQRPKTVQYGSGKNERVLKDRFRDAEPTGKPDLSNLIKLVEDGLTHYAWVDDDQIVRWTDAQKVYVHWWEQESTVIRIWLSRPLVAAVPEDQSALL